MPLRNQFPNHTRSRVEIFLPGATRRRTREEIGCGLFRIQLMFIYEDRCGRFGMRKLIAFDDDTFDKLKQLARDRMATFQELADEAFADLLRKHGIPVDLKDALRRSVRLAAEAGGGSARKTSRKTKS
jgi:hypothetical protein